MCELKVVLVRCVEIYNSRDVSYRYDCNYLPDLSLRPWRVGHLLDIGEEQKKKPTSRKNYGH